MSCPSPSCREALDVAMCFMHAALWTFPVSQVQMRPLSAAAEHDTQIEMRCTPPT